MLVFQMFMEGLVNNDKMKLHNALSQNKCNRIAIP